MNADGTIGSIWAPERIVTKSAFRWTRGGIPSQHAAISSGPMGVPIETLAGNSHGGCHWMHLTAF